MPSFMEYMRLKNLFGLPDLNSDNPPMAPQVPASTGIDMPNFASAFGPQQDPSGNVAIGPQQPVAPPAMATPSPEGYDVGRRMSELYHPESTARDRFNNLAGAYPQERESGKLRKIGGSIMGALTDLGTNLGGNRTGISGKSVYDEVTGKNKFHEDVANWKNQIGPAQQGATLERSQNVNDRTLAYETVSQELRAQAEANKTKKTDADAKIRQQRADVYEFKAKNPGLKLIFTKGGTVQTINPATGETADTGIDTGSLSDADKLALGQDNAMARIGATGNEQRRTEELRQTGRTDLEGQRQSGRQTLKGMPNGASGVQGEKPTQTRVRQFNAARELFNSEPELRPFLKIGQPGSQDFEIIPPSSGFFGPRGPNPQQYQKMKDAIYGSEALPVGQPTRTGRTPSAGGPPQNGPNLGTKPLTKGDGNAPRVKITDLNGKVIGTIPADQASKLDTTKYKVAQ